MTSAAPRNTTGCAPRRMLPVVTAPGAASYGSTGLRVRLSPAALRRAAQAS